MAVPSLAAGAWTPVATIAEFEVRDLVARSDTIVAVGCRVPAGASACSGAGIQTSVGNAWAAATLEGDTHLVELKAVAVGDAGFVAVGHRFGSEEGGNVVAVAFTSSDGRTWRQAPDQASLHGKTLSDVVARPGGGWLAVGAEAGPSVFLGVDTWTSSDGLQWTLVDAMPQVGVARGVTATKDGYTAWGTECLDVCGPPKQAALWRSKDGRSWLRVPSQPSLARGEVYEIVATPTGALAAGATYDDDGYPTGVVWRTVDGTKWTKIALPDGARHSFFRLTSTGGHYVTDGLRQSDGGDVWGTWTSADGATWTRLPDGDVRGGTFDLVASSQGVLGMAVPEPPTPSQSTVLRLGLD